MAFLFSLNHPISLTNDSSSLCFHVVSFMVQQTPICNISQLGIHLQNLFRSWFEDMESSQHQLVSNVTSLLSLLAKRQCNIVEVGTHHWPWKTLIMKGFWKAISWMLKKNLHWALVENSFQNTFIFQWEEKENPWFGDGQQVFSWVSLTMCIKFTWRELNWAKEMHWEGVSISKVCWSLFLVFRTLIGEVQTWALGIVWKPNNYESPLLCPLFALFMRTTKQRRSPFVNDTTMATHRVVFKHVMRDYHWQ
jgi:hypothetical protein